MFLKWRRQKTATLDRDFTCKGSFPLDVLKHHITKEAYQDLLSLVAGILSSPNKALKSHHTMQKYFNEVLERKRNRF